MNLTKGKKKFMEQAILVIEVDERKLYIGHDGYGPVWLNEEGDFLMVLNPYECLLLNKIAELEEDIEELSSRED